MNKTLVAFTLLIATSFAWITGNLDLSTTLASTNGIQVYGAAADRVGWSVANAGDFNNDGKEDYLIGTINGRAYLVFGQGSARTAALNLASTSLAKTEVLIFVITGASGLDVVVSAAGDMNLDGYDDIALGVPDMAGTDSSSNAVTSQGLVAVYYGISSTAITALSSATITLAPASDTISATSAMFYIKSDTADSARIGAALAGPGDILRDSDGVDDLLVGAPGINSAAGAVYMIYGKKKTSGNNGRTANVALQTLSTDSNGYTVIGVATSAIGSNLAVAGVGDINGDGKPDAILGSSVLLKAYIIYGGTYSGDVTLAASSASLTDKFTVITGPATSGFGTNVGSAGDFNGNGVKDFFIGAPVLTTNTGKVWILYGKSDSAEFADSDFTIADPQVSGGIILKGAATGTFFGQVSDGGADVNNDQVDDMIVCAPGVAPPATGSALSTTYSSITGKCYVFFGKTTIASTDLSSTTLSTTSSPATGFTITGVASSGFGKDVSVLGDINSDSGDDFAISAFAATYTGVSASGIVYEFHGVGVETTTGSGSRLGASLLVFASFFVALMF